PEEPECPLLQRVEECDIRVRQSVARVRFGCARRRARRREQGQAEEEHGEASHAPPGRQERSAARIAANGTVYSVGRAGGGVNHSGAGTGPPEDTAGSDGSVTRATRLVPC